MPETQILPYGITNRDATGRKQSDTALYALCFLMLGALIGWLAFGQGDEVEWFKWVLLLPLIWGLAKSRLSSSLVVFGFFLSASRGVPFAIGVFFGDESPWWANWGLWLCVALLSSLSYYFLWHEKKHRAIIGFIVAVILTLIPPLGLISWANPLVAAGYLYPAWGWVGLGLTLLLFGALISRSVLLICLFLGLAGLSQALGTSNSSKTAAPVGWSSVDTHFPRLASVGGDDAENILAARRRIDWLKGVMANVPSNHVVLLPETIVGVLDGESRFSVWQVEAGLAARGARVLVGAIVPLPSGQYQNGLVVLGAKAGEAAMAVQNVPAPISMWKPWANNDGALADPLGRGNIVEVNGLKVGAVVCYEQVLAFSLLWTISGSPDVLTAASNVWWARDTSVPAIQRQMVKSFGQLFDIPVLVASNF